MNQIKKLYDWITGWADTPYAVPALIVLAFAEASFFPVPPDILLIAMALGLPKKSFKFAFYTAAASVIGGMAGYAIGHFFYTTVGEPIVAAYHGEAVMQKIKILYDTYGFNGILLAAITPIPYKVFTIASGVFSFNFSLFMVASVIGRSIRFFAVAALIWKYGEPIAAFIEKYFNWLSLAFAVILIGGFLLLGKL